MQLTNKEKLEMIKLHLENGLSLSHVCEKYKYKDKSKLKYFVNLYKIHGEARFLDRTELIYRRDSKLLAISRVKNGESIRSVACDFGLTEPGILSDWIQKYNNEGEEAIQDTYPRKSYLNKDERYKANIDKKLKEENDRLKAEIEFLKKSQSLAQKLEEVTTKEKVKIVRELRTKFDLKILLEITKIPSSVYYYHQTSNVDKLSKYKEISKKIEYLYLVKHKKRCGYQRIHIELQNMGYSIGKNKVLEIMREKSYCYQKKKNYRKYNSYAGNVGHVAPNILDRNFKAEKPYEKAGTDVTMFLVNGERVYLSPLIDFKTREILSYEVGKDAQVSKVIKMIDKAYDVHKEKLKGMIIQSDQGVQYQNSRYREKLESLNIVQSMSRKGNCLDNSPTENFFGRMKMEIWYGKEKEYRNATELMKIIKEYIDYYNTTRIVTRLRMSPIEYRNQQLNMIK